MPHNGLQQPRPLRSHDLRVQRSHRVRQGVGQELQDERQQG